LFASLEGILVSFRKKFPFPPTVGFLLQIRTWLIFLLSEIFDCPMIVGRCREPDPVSAELFFPFFFCEGSFFLLLLLFPPSSSPSFFAKQNYATLYLFFSDLWSAFLPSSDTIGSSSLSSPFHPLWDPFPFLMVASDASFPPPPIALQTLSLFQSFSSPHFRGSRGRGSFPPLFL